MRGKETEYTIYKNHSGITPAYAGKSFDFMRLNAAYQDHPRLCGEKAAIVFLLVVYPGSPPPMRGKAERS